jgi:hypothetical protein
MIDSYPTGSFVQDIVMFEGSSCCRSSRGSDVELQARIYHEIDQPRILHCVTGDTKEQGISSSTYNVFAGADRGAWLIAGLWLG